MKASPRASGVAVGILPSTCESFSSGALRSVCADSQGSARDQRAGVNVHAVYVTGVADDVVELAVASGNFKKTKKI